jgi:hypothetical protein
MILLFIYRSLTGLLPERLIHLKLKAKRASLAPVPCNGCKKNHREFYSLADAGDLKGFKEIMEEVFLDLGVPFMWWVYLLEDALYIADDFTGNKWRTVSHSTILVFM